MKTINLGSAVAERRSQLGWSQHELAEVCHLNPEHVMHLECGLVAITVPIFDHLARALGIAPALLLEKAKSSDLN